LQSSGELSSAWRREIDVLEIYDLDCENCDLEVNLEVKISVSRVN
jgi:hypothetical protein